MRLIVIYEDDTRERFPVRITKTTGYEYFSAELPLTGTPRRAKAVIINRTTTHNIRVDDLRLYAEEGTTTRNGWLPLP